MSLTITIPGAVNVTTGSTAPAVLTIGVGVPGATGPQGPAGPGVPAGGTSGQFLQKTSGADYATDWVTVNLAAYAVKANNLSDLTNFTTARSNLGLGTMATATAADYSTTSAANLLYYPLTGNPSAFLQAAALSPYLLSSTAASTYQTLAGMSDYLAKAGNLAGLANTVTARTNLGLGSLAVVNDAPSDGSQYARKNGAWDVVSAAASYISSVSSPLAVTTGNLTVDLSAYLPKAGGALDVNSTITGSTATVATEMGGDFFGVQLSANPSENSSLQYGGLQVQNAIGTMSVTAFGLTFPNSSTQSIAFPGFNNTALTGSPTAPTPAFGDNDTSISTTAFVQSALAGGTAIARNLEVEVRNQSGSTIPAGSIVYISGATGNKPLITLAQANNDANSAQTIGFVKTSIANNGTGFVIVRGELENIDTSALTEGVQLYLSPTTAGTWTTTKPSAPQHLVYVGIVIRSHPTLGTILVAVQNGYELGEIHDVSLGTLVNNDLLAYESSTDLWKNKTYSALGLLTSSAAASTYAPIASPSLTGNVSIVSNSSGAALFIEQSGTGNILTLHDQASDTNFVAIDQNGKVSTIPSVATSAGFNIAHGTAPTSGQVNGDIWTTTGGLFARINGGDRQFGTLSDGLTYSGNNTFSGPTLTFGNTTAASTVNIGTGATLTATTKAINIGTNGVSGSTTNITLGSATSGATNLITVNGPMTVGNNFTATGLNINIGTLTATAFYNFGTGALATGQTRTIGIGTNALAGSTNAITIGSAAGTSTTTVEGTVTANGAALNLGTSTAAATYNLGTGATLTATTKAVNIGTSGVAGSTTNIAIGSTTGTSTTTLQGTTNGITAAADTNSVALATTAFVVGQAGSATPVVNGTAAVGTSLRYARQDHVHPTDTTRAPLASPTFTGTVTIPAGASISGFAPLASPSLTGTPLSTTAVVDTNTTQIATTAFVVAQAAAATPLVNGTAAVGTSLRYARADHVHGTDTTRAALNSPTFTGTPTLPTGTIATTQTAGNNTTAVATTAFVTAAVPGFATTAETASPVSTTKVVAPFDVVRMMLNRAAFDTESASPTFATSGTGANAYKVTNDRVIDVGTPNILTAGYGQMIYETTQSAWGMLGQKRGGAFLNQDFSKRIFMSGTHTFIAMGDANTTAYCMLGGRNSVTTGDPTNTNLRGIGWKLVGGGTALKLLTFGWNGSAVVNTETTSSFTPVIDQSFDWLIMTAPNPANPATSYCYLYVNDVLVATGINCPTDATVSYNYFYHSFESTASATARLDALIYPTKVWWSRS